MNKTLGTISPEDRRKLVERLSRIPSVRQFDEPGEPQAATLAHSLTDLEQSFRHLLDRLLPRLLDESLGPDEMNDVLHGIGEELRHVLYHLRDPKYFAYLFED